MKLQRTIFRSTVLFSTLLVLAFAGAGQAQWRQGELRFVLHDLDQPGNPIIDEVAPGGTIFLQPGQHLRVSAVVGDGERPDFLPARFRLTEGRHLSLENRATGVGVLGASTSREGWGVLRYELRRGRGAERFQRAGILRVDARGDGGLGYGDRYGDEVDSRHAREILRSLYRGILLREQDGSQHASVSAIERDGYPAVVHIARAMAASEESRFQVGRLASDEDRLAALYRHLLGLDPREVDSETWSRDLDRIEDGRYVSLVEDLVRSRDFIAHFDLGYADRWARR